MRRRGGGGRTLAATFPVPLRFGFDHGIHDLEIVRERDGGYLVNFEGGEQRFELDELGGNCDSFPNRGSNGIGKILPGRRMALCPAPRRHVFGA